jgi:hypothetical protein
VEHGPRCTAGSVRVAAGGDEQQQHELNPLEAGLSHATFSTGNSPRSATSHDPTKLEEILKISFRNDDIGEL